MKYTDTITCIDPACIRALNKHLIGMVADVQHSNFKVVWNIAHIQ